MGELVTNWVVTVIRSHVLSEIWILKAVGLSRFTYGRTISPISTTAPPNITRQPVASATLATGWRGVPS